MIYVCIIDKPSAIKEAPQITNVTSTSAVVSWIPPEDDGGAEITNYVIQYRLVDRTFWKATTTTISSSPSTVPDLKEDLEYVFKVAAENVAGLGDFSPESVSVLISGNLQFSFRFLLQLQTVYVLAGTPPKFTQRLSDETVKEDEQITLTCKVTGKPQPETQWFKDDKPLTPTENLLITSEDEVQTLTVPKATLTDGGKYTCEATNQAGVAKTTCKVKVDGNAT